MDAALMSPSTSSTITVLSNSVTKSTYSHYNNGNNNNNSGNDNQQRHRHHLYHHHHHQSSTPSSESMDEISSPKRIIDEENIDNSVDAINVVTTTKTNGNTIKGGKTSRKCFLIDSLLEERQKKLAAAAAVNKIKSLKKENSIVNFDENCSAEMEYNNEMSGKVEIDEEQEAGDETKRMDCSSASLKNCAEVSLKNAKNVIYNRSTKNFIREYKNSLSPPMSLKSQLIEDPCFLPTDPSPSNTFFESNGFIRTSTTITNSSTDCLSSDTVDDKILQKTIKNENAMESSAELLNLVSKILASNATNTNSLLRNYNEKFFNTDDAINHVHGVENRHTPSTNTSGVNNINNGIVEYTNRLKMLQTLSLAGIPPFGVFNPHLPSHYNQLFQLISKNGDGGRFSPNAAGGVTFPTTNSFSGNKNSQNSAAAVTAAAVFFQQQAAAATMALRGRLNSSHMNALEQLVNNKNETNQILTKTLQSQPIIAATSAIAETSNINNGDDDTQLEAISRGTMQPKAELNATMKAFNLLTGNSSGSRLSGITITTNGPSRHGASMASGTVHRSSNVKKYRCDICDKTFSRSNTLITHKRIHTGEKPFRCENCGRAFRQPGNLTRHAYTHTTVKPFVCTECGKAFNRASNLHTHMRVHNSTTATSANNLPTKNGLCQQLTSTVNASAASMLFNTVAAVAATSKFIGANCATCGKYFHQKYELKAHRCQGERSQQH